jgi:hypothetical protein
MTRHSHRPTLELLESRTLLATCHVTRLGDVGAGGEIGGGDSRGDLRYCITRANAEPGPDAITFSVTGTINLTGPLPDLASNIDIQGPGPDLLTVRRDTGGVYRIFTIAKTVVVQIHGMTITNGTILGGSNGALVGGAVHNAGFLTILNSIITGNRATNWFYDAYGGGIYNTGKLTLIGSRVVGNSASSHSGATVGAWVFGGGIYNAGRLSVIDSSISDNSAAILQDPLNDFQQALGGGIYNRSSGTVWLYNSTVSNNSVTTRCYECSAFGGGIFTRSHLVVHNSTISGNRTGDAQSLGIGGGVAIQSYTSAPLVIVSHSTITGNVAQWRAGGIVGGNLFVRNSIIARNTAYEYPDIYGTLSGSGYNLFGNPRGGTGFDRNTDILGVDPMLGPLTDNGGPTQTHALLPGSPAIDAGDPDIADAPQWDQRGGGFPRIVNGRIDIGAYEVQATGMAFSVPYFVLLFTANLEDDEIGGKL